MNVSSIRQSPNPYHSNVLNYLDEWGQTLNDWSNLPRIKTVSNIRFQASMGDFSYWGNSLNFSNYQSKTSFNFFDYYDGKEVYKRGGQEVVLISGKFKAPCYSH
ncbi:hypothetical protein U3516DRAFT_755968 [Neocallimastix sp. 'constans']